MMSVYLLDRAMSSKSLNILHELDTLKLECAEFVVVVVVVIVVK